MKTLGVLIFALGSIAQATCHNGGGSTQEGCSDTATLNLMGVVESLCSVSIQPEPKATALDIKGGENNTKVATVTETSNAPNGYTVTLSSQNGGVLRNGLVASASDVPYLASYNGGPEQAIQAAGVEVKSVAGSGGASTQSANDLNVTIAAVPDAAAGTYTDVLTVNITAL